MVQPIIQTQNLTKEFGPEVAVQKMSLSIPRGSIFGFIGPSGCGKTTTVRLLTGLYQPTEGDVTVLGETPTHFSRATQRKIGYMPQLFFLYDDLSVWENMNFVASLYGVGFKRKKRLEQLLEFVELGPHKRKVVRNLSGGMQRRLSLAATLIHRPLLIFLDEPTAGIDPVLRRKFWDHFQAIREAGQTLFITTQYVGEAAYCDYVGVLAEGKLLMVETPTKLRHRAFGGELVHLRTTGWLPDDLIAELQQLPYVSGAVSRLDPAAVQIVVEDAGTVMPLLMEWSKEKNVLIKSIEEHAPPFDDVFVALLKNGAVSE